MQPTAAERRSDPVKHLVSVALWALFFGYVICVFLPFCGLAFLGGLLGGDAYDANQMISRYFGIGLIILVPAVWSSVAMKRGSKGAERRKR